MKTQKVNEKKRKPNTTKNNLHSLQHNNKKKNYFLLKFSLKSQMDKSAIYNVLTELRAKICYNMALL